MTDPFQRPMGSNADEWAAFLETRGTDSIGFLAVQIAEAIEENVKRTLDATVGSTFGSLLESFIAVRDADIENDADLETTRILNMESTMQAMLELLRDKLDRR